MRHRSRRVAGAGHGHRLGWRAVAIVSCLFAHSHAAFAEGLVSSADMDMEEGGLSSQTVSPQALFANVPADAKPVASALGALLKTVDALAKANQSLKDARAEQDNVKTELVGVNGELEVVTKEGLQAEQRLEALERQRQDRLTAIRKDLEATLQEQLVQARQQIDEDLNRDFARQVQAFEARQGELIDRHLDQQLQLQETDIQQLTAEIESQTRELADRLARLEAGADLAKSIEGSTKQAIAKRKAALEASRQQLDMQRNTLVAGRREEFAAKLKEQQQAERQARLFLKEAGLRQAMAGLLHESSMQEAALFDDAQRQLDQVRKRQAQLATRQTTLTARLQTLERDLAAMAHQVEGLEAERQISLGNVDQAFQRLRVNAEQNGVLAWFAQTIQQAPFDLATDLGLIQQRVVAHAEQARQLEQQRQMLRERQLALQVSHEMERRYLQEQQQHERELEAKSRKADELLARAKQLAQRQQFDQALQLLSQALALNPPQASVIALAQEEITATKKQVQRQTQLAQVQQMFANAMQAFNQGHYDEAIPLFEQIIAQEAQLGVTPDQERVVSATR